MGAKTPHPEQDAVISRPEIHLSHYQNSETPMKAHSKSKTGKVLGHAFIESIITLSVLALLLALLLAVITTFYKNSKQKVVEGQKSQNSATQTSK